MARTKAKRKSTAAAPKDAERSPKRPRNDDDDGPVTSDAVIVDAPVNDTLKVATQHDAQTIGEVDGEGTKEDDDRHIGKGDGGDSSEGQRPPEGKSAGSGPALESKMEERMNKLKELSRLRNKSREENRKDMVKEHQNSKINIKEEARSDKKRREAEILQMRLDAEEDGKDYDRLRAMNYSVEAVEAYEKKERAKAKRADTGFTDFVQVAANKYKKMVKNIKPNLQQYNEQKMDAPLPSADDSAAGPLSYQSNLVAYATSAHSKPSEKAVERLARVVEDDMEKRKSFSRRRRFNEDDDVTYINERNMRFNQKISRAYDKHTAEIKAAFERGTAL